MQDTDKKQKWVQVLISFKWFKYFDQQFQSSGIDHHSPVEDTPQDAHLNPLEFYLCRHEGFTIVGKDRNYLKEFV